MLAMRRKTFGWAVARVWPGWALARGKRDVEEGEVGYDEGGGGSGVQYAQGLRPTWWKERSAVAILQYGGK